MNEWERWALVNSPIKKLSWVAAMWEFLALVQVVAIILHPSPLPCVQAKEIFSPLGRNLFLSLLLPLSCFPEDTPQLGQ